MRSFFLNIISIFFLINVAHAQPVLSGKILNDETGLPLNGASIYFNNTSIGSVSNAEGAFSISNAIEGELIISSVGFERLIYKIKESDIGKSSFTFRLQPKETVLQDVMVMPDETRKKYLKLFREHFLGITEEADMSKITNLNSIYFVKSSNDKNGIIASSDTPLTIINKKLGYIIEFDLGEFYLNEREGRTFFYGFTKYNEMGDRKKWIKNRRRAYYGSTVHFYRSLVNNRLEQEGYSIYKVIEDTTTKTGITISSAPEKMAMAITVKATDIVKKDTAGKMYLADWGKKLMVQYHKKPAGKDYLAHKMILTGAMPNGFRSYLITERPGIRIDESGLLEDPLKVFVSGYWIYEKAANQLPYNYVPDKED